MQRTQTPCIQQIHVHTLRVQNGCTDLSTLAVSSKMQRASPIRQALVHVCTPLQEKAAYVRATCTDTRCQRRSPALAPLPVRSAPASISTLHVSGRPTGKQSAVTPPISIGSVDVKHWPSNSTQTHVYPLHWQSAVVCRPRLTLRSQRQLFMCRPWQLSFLAGDVWRAPPTLCCWWCALHDQAARCYVDMATVARSHERGPALLLRVVYLDIVLAK